MSGFRAPTYPFNAWYMAAWAGEISQDLFSRHILAIPVALFRLSDGSPVAFEDKCPHRFAPLSKGRNLGDRIACAYHGLQFDGSGRCVANPGGNGHFPPNTQVRTFPLVERQQILWVWMGDPAQADASAIPELPFVPAPDEGRNNLGNYLFVRANYLLEIDNIMDLTHVSFLHEGTLGNASMRSAEVAVSEKNGRIRADLWMPNTLCGFGEMQGQPCDQWNHVEWMAPSTMVLEFGAVPAGAEPVQERHNYAYHIFTPANETETHYFFGSSGAFGADEARKVDLIREAQNRVFLTEDNPMIEAIADRMAGADFWSLRPAILPSDAAAIRVRRRIQQMCRAECTASNPPPSLSRHDFHNDDNIQGETQ